MWKGTKEQFFELYRVTANHLKKCFPDLKIGGYASCGFYPLTRADSAKPGHWHWSFIDWFETFLDYVQAEETRAPLDFFSWHLYTSDPEEIVIHSKYVDEKLKAHGMENVENIFNEWKYITGRPDQFDEMKEAPGAAFVAAAFCLMQYQTGIDKAMYYDAYPQRAYCGLYYFPSRKVTKTYWSFYAFNVLYKLGTAVPVTTDQAAKIYALAAKNEAGDAAILVVNNSDEAAEVPLEIKGADFAGAEDLANYGEGVKNGWTLTGALLGLLVTYIYDSRVQHFDEKAPFLGQVCKLVLGLACVIAIRLGLSLLFGKLFPGQSFWSMPRYFLMVIMAGCIWPKTFPFWQKVGVKKAA